ncbi:TPA: hypothetical protein VB511_001182 [Streptococcus pyogenes]|uniref:exotoxin OB-fold domain-containing protein n=1 Tax=Streptococcus pyogenes TaxID=1314 RepID=UPI00109C8413|nr:hypothetical protein [Streptococcus pyogenes]
MKSSLKHAYETIPYDYSRVKVVTSTSHTIKIQPKEKWGGEFEVLIDSTVNDGISNKFVVGTEVDVFGIPYSIFIYSNKGHVAHIYIWRSN